MQEKNKLLNEQDRQFAKYEEQVQDIVRKSASSFYLGMRFMPEARRKAMYAVYAFCRIVDDIADEPDTLENKEKGLNEWENIIKSIYNNDELKVLNPVAECLKKAVKDFNLPQEELLGMINGMRMDMLPYDKPWSAYKVWLYCRRVAGTVGTLSVHIFGSSSEKAKIFAKLLGEALQTTNILRDMQEDFANNRCYIPEMLLDKYGMSDLSPAEIAEAPSLWLIRSDMGRHSEHLYEMADEVLKSMPADEQKLMKPALLMRNIYFAYFCKMKKRGWDISTKVKISKLGKIIIALKGFL